ncbi:MAG: type II secretion system protein [Candidatus Saccharimonas sp.]
MRPIHHNSYERARLFTRPAFTVIELLIIIVVLGILAVIVNLAYNGAQQRTADAVVQDTIKGGRSALVIYHASNTAYPSNFANAEYAPPTSVAVTLFTDTAQSPVYSGLTSEQNAQLFLNTCNGFMPIVSGGTTYNTVCVYNGNNLHVKGTGSSNVVIQGPSIASNQFVLNCGAACNATQSTILSTFQAQGGTFPVTVVSSGANLPAPTLVSSGAASRYCLQARSAAFPNIVYYITTDMGAYAQGECPTDASLHYP